MSIAVYNGWKSAFVAAFRIHSTTILYMSSVLFFGAGGSPSPYTASVRTLLKARGASWHLMTVVSAG